MMMKSVAALCAVMVVFLVVEMHGVAAVDCNPTALLPCLPAYTGGTNPSQDCCNNLKEQEPCFCQYLNDPASKPYVDSPNAKKIAAVCGVAIPTNC